MNEIAVVIVGMLVHGDTDAIDILGEFITRRDIIFHGDAAKRRCWIDWDDAVLVVDVLKSLQEVTDEWLDGVVIGCIGGLMDVNVDEGIIQGVRGAA